MIQVYSTNVTTTALSPIPLDNVTFKKGNTATLNGTSTIGLNKCGVYCVTIDSSSEAAATIQLYVNGVAQADAVSTGTNAGFTKLISVAENNTNCPCSAPTIIQFVSTEASTFTNVNVVVTKLI